TPFPYATLFRSQGQHTGADRCQSGQGGVRESSPGGRPDGGFHRRLLSRAGDADGRPRAGDGRQARSRRLLPTTSSELTDIAAAASIGLSRPTMARGTVTAL